MANPAQQRRKENTTEQEYENTMANRFTYEQVSANEEIESPISPTSHSHQQIPTSPPPSFRSRASSPQSRQNRNGSDGGAVDQNLADTFDADGSDDEADNDGDDRQRLMRATPASSIVERRTGNDETADSRPATIERRPTQLPVFTRQFPEATTRPSGRVYGGGSGSDGVFANLSAKPESGEKMEEHPPVSPIPLHWKLN